MPGLVLRHIGALGIKGCNAGDFVPFKIQFRLTDALAVRPVEFVHNLPIS